MMATGRQGGAHGALGSSPARLARAVVAVALASGLAGCSATASGNVAAHRLLPLAPGEIRSIAVMPFTQAGLHLPPSEPGQEPLVEPPADTATRVMAEALRRYPDWQIVDPAAVTNTFVRLYGEVRAPTPEEAVAVGKRLGIDAVLRGEVLAFDERVGSEIGAKRPAHVGFAVELDRIPSGERVWQAEYDETQQALSDNFLNVAGFFRAGAKWVRAGELAEIGAEQVAAPLHETLTGSKKPPPGRRATQ